MKYDEKYAHYFDIKENILVWNYWQGKVPGPEPSNWNLIMSRQKDGQVDLLCRYVGFVYILYCRNIFIFIWIEMDRQISVFVHLILNRKLFAFFYNAHNKLGWESGVRTTGGFTPTAEFTWLPKSHATLLFQYSLHYRVVHKCISLLVGHPKVGHKE